MKTKETSLALLLAIFFCFACSSPKTDHSDIPENAINPAVIENPASADGPTKAKVPVMTFHETEHDFGTIIDGEQVSYAFRFENTGDGDLLIRSASGSCGCTVPEWPKDPIAPGKSGVINVTFNSEGRSGTQNKTVTLVANTLPNTTTISIKAEVEKAK